MKQNILKNKYLITLWILCLITLFFMMGHYSNVLIDFGREVYYPQRILEGKVLYRDLFTIYGPFSYQLNAILYKILGTSLNTLYLSGCICSLLVVSGIYFISRKFLSEILSFSIGFFVISTSILTFQIHNFTFPYSWAMVYGFVSFLYSVLFWLKFQENKQPKFLYISTLLAGISVCNKYEFATYAIIVMFFIVKTSIKDIKTGFLALCSFLFIPILSIGVLALQGLKINEFIDSLMILKAMANSETIKFFYQNVGVYFHPQTLPILISKFIFTTAAFVSIMLCQFIYKKHRISAVILGIVSLVINILVIAGIKQFQFIFLPLLLIIFALISWKKLKQNPMLFILVASAISVSLKLLWGLIVLGYGTYCAGLLLIAFFGLLFSYLNEEYQKSAAVFILLISTFFVLANLFQYENYSVKIESPKGNIYTYKSLADSVNDLILYIKTNTKETDRIIIYPEGMTINFLTNRKSDDYYNSLIPLYLEVLGEQKIIDHFEETKPEYIIFNNAIMREYGFDYICDNYALGLCSYVSVNYSLETVIDYDNRFLVYKRK